MNSTGLVGNPVCVMSAMQFCTGWAKKMWPRSRGERSHMFAETNSRKEGTHGAQGRRRSARGAGIDIGGWRLLNNQAERILAMHWLHIDMEKSNRINAKARFPVADLRARFVSSGALFKAFAGSQWFRQACRDARSGRSAAGRAALPRARRTRSDHGAHRWQRHPQRERAGCRSAANCRP